MKDCRAQSTVRVDSTYKEGRVASAAVYRAVGYIRQRDNRANHTYTHMIVIRQVERASEWVSLGFEGIMIFAFKLR